MAERGIGALAQRCCVCSGSVSPGFAALGSGSAQPGWGQLRARLSLE